MTREQIDAITPATPPYPAPPIDAAAAASEHLANLGLFNYSPVGLVQWVIDALHSHLDLPWCGAIACSSCPPACSRTAGAQYPFQSAATLLLRTLALPLNIQVTKFANRTHNVQPQIMRIQQRAQKASKISYILYTSIYMDYPYC